LPSQLPAWPLEPPPVCREPPAAGLVERMNWLGRPLAEDDFGRALLAAGIPEDTLLAWTKDPQVGGRGGT